jgi:DNA-binding beta-propeller fold protein YncE
MAIPEESGLGPEFQYDLSAFLKVDPALVRWREAAAHATSLDQPRGLAALPDGGFLVAGDAKVRRFGADGKPAAEFAAAGPAYAVAVGPDGTVYAALKDRVQTFDASGKAAAAWPALGDRAYLTSIAAGPQDVFVADAGQRVVLRYDPAGKLVGRIGEENEARRAPGLLVPSPYLDVALGADGMLWVVNPGRRRVDCYTYDGDFRFAWGKASMKIEGFCGCCNPTHLAVLKDGSFVTSEKGLPRVKTYGPEGDFADVVAAPAQFAEGVTGLDLAVDIAGRVLVLDPSARTVRVFERKAPEGK